MINMVGEKLYGVKVMQERNRYVARQTTILNFKARSVEGLGGLEHG